MLKVFMGRNYDRERQYEEINLQVKLDGGLMRLLKTKLDHMGPKVIRAQGSKEEVAEQHVRPPNLDRNISLLNVRDKNGEREKFIDASDNGIS